MLYEAESLIIVPTFYAVHRELQGGLRESMYRDAMHFALADAGLASQVACEVPFYFRGRALRRGRIDLLVAGKIIVECKARAEITDEHRFQLLQYLKSTGFRLGYVLNFGDKPTFKRMIHDRDNPYPPPPP